MDGVDGVDGVDGLDTKGIAFKHLKVNACEKCGIWFRKLSAKHIVYSSKQALLTLGFESIKTINTLPKVQWHR